MVDIGFPLLRIPEGDGLDACQPVIDGPRSLDVRILVATGDHEKFTDAGNEGDKQIEPVSSEDESPRKRRKVHFSVCV